MIIQILEQKELYQLQQLKNKYMNIKDYLHLYLPFEAVIAPVLENENTTKAEINSLDVWKERCYDTDGFDWSFKNVLPILRPLSDMAEEEFREVLYDETTEEFGGITFMEQFKNAIENINIEDVVLTPHQTKYLLTQHFDLFGLIESGLALSKSEVSANG